MGMLSQMVLGNVCILLHISLESEQKKKYTQTLIQRISPSNPFCSLYRIIHYIKCNMLSKSSKWELGFVHYIAKFTISRFVISRFECTNNNCSRFQNDSFQKQFREKQQKNFFNKKVICYSVVNKVILKKSISKS